MPPLVQCKELESSVGYSQVRSLQGSFGSHKEMFIAKLIELSMMDKVVQQVC